MAEAQKPARDATWDIARGIGMMLVIYGHLLEPIYPANRALGQPLMQDAAVQWQTIYSFHMMLFFLVSGAVNLKLPKRLGLMPFADHCGSWRWPGWFKS